MNALVIGVYGFYLVLVGLNGNAGTLSTNVQADAPKFLPWIIAIFVLSIVNSTSDVGRKITGPFLFLLVLSFVLKRFDTLKSQTVQLWDMAAQAGSGTGAAATPAPASSSAPAASPSPAPASSAPAPSPAQSFSNAADALSALEGIFG